MAEKSVSIHEGVSKPTKKRVSKRTPSKWDTGKR
jgi:hypothetical protein